MRHGVLKRSAQLFVFLLIAGACLFISAGRLDWWNAWLFLGLYVVGIVATGAVLIRKDPDLIAERASYKKDAKSWDKLLTVPLGLCGPIAIWITAGLDARNHWSDSVSGPGEIAGVAVMAAGYLVVSRAMLSNPFFSALVRIQKERGHRVATGGPYRFVRHPGYVGMIAFTLATPLVLNSLWAFVPATITTALVVLRTALEDRMLRLELDGYADYTRRVRYRLAPGLW